MHGIGNDFVLIDTLRDGPLDGDFSVVSKTLCDRRFGIGADGILLVEKSADQLVMRMFNPDGSESEMCGNGLRVFAKFCFDRGYAGSTFSVQTGAGLLSADVHDDSTVSLDMGLAYLSPQEVGMANVSGETFIAQPLGEGLTGTAISMGNPHLVLFTDDVASIDLERIGPELEHHRFFPQRTNVHFVQVVSNHEIIQRTWERGAGITLACGTGACASAVASFLNNKTGRSVKVNLPGGSLFIDYREDGSVLMRGPAEYSFEGSSGSLL